MTQQELSATLHLLLQKLKSKDLDAHTAHPFVPAPPVIPANVAGLNLHADVLRNILAKISKEHTPQNADTVTRISVVNGSGQQDCLTFLFNALSTTELGRSMAQSFRRQNLDAFGLWNNLKYWYGMPGPEAVDAAEKEFKNLRCGADPLAYILAAEDLLYRAQEMGSGISVGAGQLYILRNIPVLTTARDGLIAEITALGAGVPGAMVGQPPHVIVQAVVLAQAPGIAWHEMRHKFRAAQAQATLDAQNMATVDDPVPDHTAQVSEEVNLAQQLAQQLARMERSFERQLQEAQRNIERNFERKMQNMGSGGGGGGGNGGGEGGNGGGGAGGGGGGRVCFNFRDTGSCRHGDRCRFTHNGGGNRGGGGRGGRGDRGGGGRGGGPGARGGNGGGQGSSGGDGDGADSRN